MVFKPTLNITEQIADHLAQLVIRDQLLGGARIQELKIANELGVSRGSVREALLILERRHLIEIVPRKGAVVNEICGREALELVDILSAAEHRLMPQFIHGADAREALAAAAPHIAEMEQGARRGALDDVLEARRHFYAELLSAGTRYLQGVFECLLPSSQRLMRRLALQADVDLHDISRYYKALLDALEVKDEERVEELLNAFHKRLRGLCERAAQTHGKMPKTLKKMAFS
jgi:DNA-binding GntR family transcriptional regulator